MLGFAVGIQRDAIRPLLDKNEMAGIFLVDTQLISVTKRLLQGFSYSFPV
ncbi:antibiotic biosynthesis monooxygenase [Yersinia entomophaga]|uniref:Antibiotic biosynthesis monooxygenase n=1 Tax=Yersinia entomophaga TaxID=935293 RepID=A0ABN4PP74_YERET|nr:antibiotic biosynthesis monooxygenase [Yersinia entomophaga]